MPKGRPASNSRPAFGERIARLRVAAGLTQEQLAEAMGVTQRVVTYWEREARSVRADQLAELAGVLGTGVDALLHGSGPAKKQRLPAVIEKLQSLPKKRQTEILKQVESLIAEAPRARKSSRKSAGA